MAVAMLRRADSDSPVPILAVFDGAYANRTVIRPCLDATKGRRIDVVTRLRYDARLYRPVQKVPVRGPGRPRTWGERLPAPQDHGRWGVRWQSGRAYLYGRERALRFKERSCRWSVAGADEPVRVFVFEVEGYDEPWFLATTSTTLTPSEVVTVFCARFRQEKTQADYPSKQEVGRQAPSVGPRQPNLSATRPEIGCGRIVQIVRTVRSAGFLGV